MDVETLPELQWLPEDEPLLDGVPEELKLEVSEGDAHSEPDGLRLELTVTDSVLVEVCDRDAAEELDAHSEADWDCVGERLPEAV